MDNISLHALPITRLPTSSYRWLAGLSLLLALVLMWLVPHDQRRLRMPDPWTYEVAAAQFAQGHWTLNLEQMTAVMQQLETHGEKLILYVRTGPDAWALRKAPGHPLEMALFQMALGSTRQANMAWAVLGTAALYLLLAAKFNEKLALAGTIFFLWSPLSLLALHYYNMDSYAAGVAPLAAGALLLWYAHKRPSSPFIPLLVGLLAGWMVVVRLTNALLMPLFIFFAMRMWWEERPFSTPTKRTILAFNLGLALPLLLLGWYNWHVFGRILDSGYFYHSPYDQEFLWFAGGLTAELASQSAGEILKIIPANLWLWLQPATLAWPLWPLAAWGLAQTWRRSRVGAASLPHLDWYTPERGKKPRLQTPNYFLTKQSRGARGRESLTWFWCAWLLLVYAPYAGLAFGGANRALTNAFNQSWGFFSPTRYLFPLTLPLIFLLVAFLSRRSGKVVMGITAVYTLLSLWLFFTALSRASLIVGLG